ncbi:hypothetical protein L1987_09920 [Smallanthus sonchifolius]|uniref:Uncharacterized protein n=1 Tax=Smallanthus sonchifolius TaxID=185202 RepID=A0ACB9JQM8_9ASTR|nr:hypothetical protein L1987_09920 [Smallanthus sonchifolius]
MSLFDPNPLRNKKYTKTSDLLQFPLFPQYNVEDSRYCTCNNIESSFRELPDVRRQSSAIVDASEMSLVFSNNHHLIPPSYYTGNESESPPDLVSDSNLKNGYQAVNLCPNCKTAYYFRPYKMAPLQGRFVEIGRVKNSNGFFKIGVFVGSEEVEVDVDDDDIVVQDCEV